MLDFEESIKLSALFSCYLHSDTHNGKNGYLVRSLYFDTPFDNDYYDKSAGLEVRKKVRLRCYSPSDSFAVLEIKQKQGEKQRKRSLKVSKEDAIRISKGDYAVLLEYDNPFASECYALMKTQCYFPKIIVQYNRKAFVEKENNIRITFDANIEATSVNLNIFEKNLLVAPVLDRFNVVLEVKYNRFILSYIKQLLDSTDKSKISVSKYCIARESLI